jgi:hypothetical protein
MASDLDLFFYDLRRRLGRWSHILRDHAQGDVVNVRF